ncbi:MAG TPA: M23 family metallopeptidase [Polyangia bacterium]|nr:M23 family metallopeptidase [Polyangia bacterium]
MTDPEETPSLIAVEGPALCDVCGDPLRATRYVHVEARTIDVLCSIECLRFDRWKRRRARWSSRARAALRTAVAAVLTAALLTPHTERSARRRFAQAATAPRPTPADATAAGLPAGWFGPEWPPSDTTSLAALGHDAWIHPLSGPVRRMPRADSRVFGAVRPGQRPAECRNGHCGVDLGGEIWGEHVHAVHDGLVDFVQRNANPDRGGEFVRIAHHDGTVFTWYFHLAAIPRGIERGVYVKSGQVIGLLGDTGVKESAPHLHFAITVRPWKDGPERYLDPEPLIALWPVRVPIDGGESGLVTTLARPGWALGSMPLLSARKRAAARLAKARRGSHHADDATGAESGGPDDAAGAAAASDAPADADSDGAPDGSGDE